jgi:dTDP-4-dehydrorhamnose 3,5-epimerase
MIEGVQIFQDTMRHLDSRGLFQRVAYPFDRPVVEMYHSWNNANVFRGMHMQKGQGKAVYCLLGEIIDYILDLRTESPTYGQLMTLVLPLQAPYGLWIPPGCAHGFKTLKESLIQYVMDTPFDVRQYVGASIPSLSKGCMISEKDANLPIFEQEG